MPNLVILTGAGISAESGLPTFRGNGGLWENHRFETLATPQAFAANPALVHRFYNHRRAQLKQVEPNEAHHALAQLERDWPGDFLLVTQNVDNLHERAGSQTLLHMHGELAKLRCTACNHVTPHTEPASTATPCPACAAFAMRPHIVWFGEIPFFMEAIYDALATADIFVAIGTSGVVYPAAGFAAAVPRRCRTIELNPDPTGNPTFREIIPESAVAGLTQLLALL